MPNRYGIWPFSLWSNYRPGVLDRLGLGYDHLKALNPRLIYCVLSGFGQSGPYRDLPSYDVIAQGMSGIMSVAGEAENVNDRGMTTSLQKEMRLAKQLEKRMAREGARSRSQEVPGAREEFPDLIRR